MREKNEPGKKFYPLAVNILKLQHYSDFFDLYEIVLLEWFIVKAASFKFKQFFYSNERISEEVHIKDDKLNSIKKKLQQLGVIKVELKGLPRVSWYEVNFDVIMGLIPQIYQLPENRELIPNNRELLAFYRELLTKSSEQKNINKNNTKENIKEKYDLKGEDLHANTRVSEPPPENNLDLNRSRNNQNPDSLKSQNPAAQTGGAPPAEKQKSQAQLAREAASLKKELEAHQKEKEANAITCKAIINELNIIYEKKVQEFNSELKNADRKKVVTKLAFRIPEKEALIIIHKEYGAQQIYKSFKVFIDDYFEGDIRPRHLMPYFFKRTKVGDYDTFLTYLDQHKHRYIIVSGNK